MAKKYEFKNSYVFATATGFKVVNKDTLKVERHAGSKSEIEEHAKLGIGAGTILESKIDEKKNEEQKMTETKIKGGE